MQIKIFYAVALVALFMTSCDKSEPVASIVEEDLNGFDVQPLVDNVVTIDDITEQVRAAFALSLNDSEELTKPKPYAESEVQVSFGKRSSAANNISFTPSNSGDQYLIHAQRANGTWEEVYWGSASSFGSSIPVISNPKKCGNTSDYQYRIMWLYSPSSCPQMEITFSRTGYGGIDTDFYSWPQYQWFYFRSFTEDYIGGASEYAITAGNCSGGKPSC